MLDVVHADRFPDDRVPSMQKQRSNAAVLVRTHLADLSRAEEAMTSAQVPIKVEVRY